MTVPTDSGPGTQQPGSPHRGPQHTLRAAVVEFSHQLREAAIPVSMAEVVDAVTALQHVDLSDRVQVKTALGATLVKRAEDWPDFDVLFDQYFTPRRHTSAVPHPPSTEHERAESSSSMSPSRPAPPAAPPQPPASEEMRQALVDAFATGNEHALGLLAARAVHDFAGLEHDERSSERSLVYRVLRQLDLSALLQQAIRAQRAAADGRDALGDRLALEEQQQLVEEFHRMLTAEIRHRLAERESQDRPATVSGAEDVDFLGACPSQLRQMQHILRPLARHLITRIAHRRKLRSHGQRLDVRRTIRRSLAAGGVPLDPAYRRPKPSRPDLCLLCDVSGSVAEFAAFTLMLLQSMSEEFPHTRSFAFVDGVDEVTEHIGPISNPLQVRHLLARSHVVWDDGHSDYGKVFARFRQRYPDAVTQKTTVIVTGDARNNFRAEDGAEHLRAIRAEARHVYWLNPEPRASWDTTDSVISRYAPWCDAVHEVCNLRQMEDFVYSLV
jgi:uncharacterized protein